MNLHENKQLFDELVAVAAQIIGLPQVYVEKDYWVTKALQHLSVFSRVDEVVFKGGTSLSKAYRLIDRFSEDIDLVIFSEGMTQNACKTLIKQVETSVAQGLIYLKDDIRESKGSKFRKTVYQYPQINESDNFGQASSKLLIEINSFSNPEPFEKIEIRSLITDVLIEQKRQDIIDQYYLHGFMINVLSVKRTLVEKILGVVKDSYEDNPVAKLSNRVRHLYDICLILKHDEYRNFVSSKDFKSLCDICIIDEKTTFLIKADCFDRLLIEAPLFSEFNNWSKSIGLIYNGIFADLVYRELPTMTEIGETLGFIRDNL
ncbi:MAG: nucleotidyl transferase AbiEii/AbiGii toxin family protein [Proteobacteria bacterium]|nr:nucleotidyl transferase AbiEii/AbiGii toxin family protein [Pseudomonadota bacterium]